VTDREFAQQVEDALKQTLEQVAEAVHWVGPDGVILWANQTELDLLGYERDAYIGRHIAEFHVDPPVIEDILTRLTCGETLDAYVARLRCKDGTIRTVEINSNVLFRDGKFLHTQCFTRDVTERLSRDAQLRELQQQTADALAAARAAERRKDEFLAILGHELRNPLAPILTAVELMKVRAAGVAEREREIIERQVRHVCRLVDDLLDLSRITQGKLQLSADRVTIASVIGRSVELAAPAFDAKRHQLVISVAEGIEVAGDAVRLAQVFSNLLTNAAKFTEPGGTIKVSAAGEGTEVIVRVSDSGIGLSEHMLDRIFEPFEQGQDGQGGLGLGLALARRLVELHGGSIFAASEGAGRGSTFTVTVPVAAADVVSSTQARMTPRTPNVLRQRVLVVDDNVDAAEMLAAVLVAHGHVATVASDGPTALREAARVRPDVAILDLGLPVMDGYELFDRLHEAHPALRCIALTGYGQELDRKRTHEAGFEHHFVKPVPVDDLLAALESSPTT
jgi:PAS domain S-box-containing protein